MTATPTPNTERVRFVCCAPCREHPDGERCLELDGSIWPLTQAPRPPLHGACFCVLEPISDALTFASHPVDIAKNLIAEMGEKIDPEVEAEMRRLCDEEVPANDSDARAIAMWCWPTEGTGKRPSWLDYNGRGHEFHLRDPGYANEDDYVLRSVADAERVLIERGYSEAYGRALQARLFGGGPPWGDEEHFRTFSPWEIACFATAPLEARVRAMAAVIRALP